MNMDSRIVVPLALTVVPAALKEIVESRIPTRVFIGGAAYALFVTALAEGAPQLVFAFTWVVAITSLLVNGGVVFKTIERIIK